MKEKIIEMLRSELSEIFGWRPSNKILSDLADKIIAMI